MLSILLPTYNRGHCLGGAIESVLRQKFTNWELLVVDDGSTDGTAACVRGYSDPRVRYFFQDNADQLNALTLVADKIGGDFVTLLHSDDRLVDADVFERMMADLTFSVDGLYADLVKIDDRGRTTGRIGVASRVGAEFPAAMLRRFCANPVPDHFFVHRAVFERFVIPNYLRDNTPYYFNYATGEPLRLKKVAPWYAYRVHGGNYRSDNLGEEVVLNGRLRIPFQFLRNGYRLRYMAPTYHTNWALSRISSSQLVADENRVSVAAFGERYYAVWAKRLLGRGVSALTAQQLRQIVLSYRLGRQPKRKSLVLSAPDGRTFQGKDARRFYSSWPNVGEIYRRILWEDYDHVAAPDAATALEARTALDFFSLAFPIEI